jgi:hypothetical protein
MIKSSAIRLLVEVSQKEVGLAAGERNEILVPNLLGLTSCRVIVSILDLVDVFRFIEPVDVFIFMMLESGTISSSPRFLIKRKSLQS